MKYALLISILTSCFLAPYNIKAQEELYIDDNGIFYLGKDEDFTTSNTVITHHPNGIFAIEAGATWSEATEYVDGRVQIIGNGSTTSNLGDNGQSIIIVDTANSDDIVNTQYYDVDPSSISTTVDPLLIDYYLSDTEYWSVDKVSGTSTGYVISGTTPSSSATYNGAASSGDTKLVWFDGSKWAEYTGNMVEGYFSYVSKNSSLSTTDLDQSSFKVYPNPVRQNQDMIFYSIPGSTESLTIKIYDSLGRLVFSKDDASTSQGVNSIQKPQVENGIYMINFILNGGENLVTKKIVIK